MDFSKTSGLNSPSLTTKLFLQTESENIIEGKDYASYYGRDAEMENNRNQRIEGNVTSSIRKTISTSCDSYVYSPKVEKRNYEYYNDNGYQYQQNQRSICVTSDDHDNRHSEDNYYDDYDDDWDRKPVARTFRKKVYDVDDYQLKLPATRDTNCNNDTKTKIFSNVEIVPYKMTDQKRKLMIKVSPGCILPLRGADETWNAIWKGFYMPHQCICCKLTIFCIQDANYVLCPSCRVVNPLLFDIEQDNNRVGGVGLGFVLEDLVQWQSNIKASTQNIY